MGRIVKYFEIKGYDNGKNTLKAKLAGAQVVTSKDIKSWFKGRIDLKKLRVAKLKPGHQISLALV